MRTYLDCYPCFLSQALRTARMITDSEEEILGILSEVCAFLAETRLGATPPEIGRRVYRIVAARTGVDDPFADVKSQCTRAALSFYPKFKRYVRDARDPLRAAVRLAIAGNIIDFGANIEFDLQRDVRDILNQEFSVDDYADFRRALEKAGQVLYLGDNAGETVFDRILIEQLGKPVVFAVRESPVINDAVWEDAEAAGLNGVAEIISSGCTAPGTILNLCSRSFVRRMEKADLIISKGQGNYEGLSEENLPIFFLLKAKCRVIAQDIGIESGGIVLKSARSSSQAKAGGKRRETGRVKLVIR